MLVHFEPGEIWELTLALWVHRGRSGQALGTEETGLQSHQGHAHCVNVSLHVTPTHLLSLFTGSLL